jgi:hypothetical protein
MIVYNPSSYSNRDLRDDKFYKDLLSSLNISSGGSVVISPWVVNGDFGVVDSTSLFDIGNLAAAVTVSPAVPTARTLFHGNLFLKVYCSAFVANDTGAMWLSTGPNDNLTNWLVTRQIITSSAGSINHDHEYIYQSVAFNYLRMSIGNSGTTYLTEFLFNGVKIVY